MVLRSVPLVLPLVLPLVALVLAGDAHAETPAAEPVTGPAAEVDWTRAPAADQASGIERDEPAPASSKVRSVGRALLFVPKWLVWGVAQPMRGGAYVYDRYNLPSVYDRTFYSSDRTFGIYPSAKYESGYGFTGGVRLVHHDVLGNDERVKLRANFGGQFRFGYGVNLNSGRRLGERVALDLDFGHERRSNERFFGIGNADALAAMPESPIDPAAGAFDTRFREDMVRGVARTDIRLVGPLEARFSGALSSRMVEGTGDSDSIDRAYMTDQLVGWEGVQHLRMESELVYDSRRPTNPYMSSALDATGWLASVHAGATRGVGRDQTSFQSYGGQVQRFIDLYRGSRVLALRGLYDTVAGDGPISFLDLPRIGGTDVLRGYPGNRFRDRTIGVGSAEYTWDLGNFLAAYTFVDVGRVWRSFDNMAADNLRVGYGGGIQMHTSRSFVGRAQLAASRDGDVFLELVLSPAFPRRERVGRF